MLKSFSLPNGFWILETHLQEVHTNFSFSITKVDGVVLSLVLKWSLLKVSVENLFQFFVL